MPSKEVDASPEDASMEDPQNGHDDNDNDNNNDNDEYASDSDNGEDLLLGNEKKLVVLPGATMHSVSFQIEKEDHTLGNALRYFISKNPDVEFCGYTIPHPSETKMNVRIQTWEDTNTTAFDALRKGLNDMIEACDIVTTKFTNARDEFNEEHGIAT